MTIELEPTTWKEKPSKTSTTDELAGAECNLALKGQGIIKLTLTQSQYQLMASAMAGTLKDRAVETCKLLALELNRQLMCHQQGAAEQIGRINDHIEENLCEETLERWKQKQNKSASKRETRKKGTSRDDT